MMEEPGLHLAASNNCPDVAEFFLAQGANVNFQDSFGRTPLREKLLRIATNGLLDFDAARRKRQHGRR